MREQHGQENLVQEKLQQDADDNCITESDLLHYLGITSISGSCWSAGWEFVFT